MSGKGDKPRRVDGPKYRENFDRIFKKDRIIDDQWHGEPVDLEDMRTEIEAVFFGPPRPRYTIEIAGTIRCPVCKKEIKYLYYNEGEEFCTCPECGDTNNLKIC
jgi:hypothetical protein